MELSIKNVINVSLALAGAGAGKYNTSNVALFTAEEFQPSFGILGYKIYKSATEIGVDFGTSSKTYLMAVSAFSQKPNFLGADGYLVVIPTIDEAQNIAFDAISASGEFVLTHDGNDTAPILFSDSAAQIQTKLRVVAGLEKVIVTGSVIAQSIDIVFDGVEGPIDLLTTSGNTLLDGAAGAVAITVTETQDGETLGQAVTRTASLVQYFGIMSTYILNQTEMLAAAAIVETMTKMIFFASITASDLNNGGQLDLLRSGSLSQSRGLYYGGTETEALQMMAAYVGRALSTLFAGNNTTQTMHLKDLIGIQPDATMSESLLVLARAAGVDTYVSIQGVPKVFCTNGNTFFDRVYNRLWFIGRIEVDGFNVLAQTSTKIAQTEDGVSSLTGAYRKVCEQAVTNQFLAAGTWTSPNTFGVQADFFANIEQRGYYIYSAPLSQQSAVDRADRKAPIASIALKEAGAIHSANILININA